MSARLRHFAINADDVGRAKAFYEKVFGWAFNSWGPPNFFQVKNAGDGLMGALQERSPMNPHTSFMTTFEVEDIRATLKAIEENGGRVAMPPYKIEGVGEIAYFQDCEGNTCGIGQYEPGHFG